MKDLKYLYLIFVSLTRTAICFWQVSSSLQNQCLWPRKKNKNRKRRWSLICMSGSSELQRKVCFWRESHMLLDEGLLVTIIKLQTVHTSKCAIVSHLYKNLIACSCQILKIKQGQYLFGRPPRQNLQWNGKPSLLLIYLKNPLLGSL